MSADTHRAIAFLLAGLRAELAAIDRAIAALEAIQADRDSRPALPEAPCVE